MCGYIPACAGYGTFTAITGVRIPVGTPSKAKSPTAWLGFLLLMPLHGHVEPVGFDNIRPFTQGLMLDAGPVLLFLGRRSRAPGFGARDSSREDWSQRDEQSPWGVLTLHLSCTSRREVFCDVTSSGHLPRKAIVRRYMRRTLTVPVRPDVCSFRDVDTRGRFWLPKTPLRRRILPAGCDDGPMWLPYLSCNGCS